MTRSGGGGGVRVRWFFLNMVFGHSIEVQVSNMQSDNVLVVGTS